MKSGTAQNCFEYDFDYGDIRIGRVEDTRMVNMQLTIPRLIERGVQHAHESTGITDYQIAKKLLLKYGT